mmetsp:Transcript_20372/g.52908  ORF Transcript_20372/g.52908 Transcript_20372/m.52908 type:complete len:319 (+) Transcript_20372:31-987(+)
MDAIEGAPAFAQALETNALVVAHFWADWAPQCKQIDAVLTELGRLYGNLKFITVEAEKNVEVAQKHGVVAVPTVLLFNRGVMADRVDGANVPVLAKLAEKLSKTRPAAPAAPGPAEASDARLKELINAAPVMLFMKGTPEEPECGFSRKIVATLKEKGIEYSYFNILADSAVRARLKVFSDWPTYPQLYIGGDLVGGLDIVNEMAASGDLEAAIPKPGDLDSRLEGLINREKIMVFIKGTRDAPRCGFSRTILGILKEEGVDFGYYDILGDETVRQGLKKFSDWPTYPQLYVDGEFMGGLDIVKEMKASGELPAALGK